MVKIKDIDGELENSDEEDETSIIAKAEVAQGTYTNIAQIQHSGEEFEIDFFLQDSNDTLHLVSRIITSPAHTKRLLNALKNNIGKYESKFGEIEEKKPSKDIKEKADGE